ncbi:MAG: ATP synthase subunit I [Ilumatobacteraceae bacterium]
MTETPSPITTRLDGAAPEVEISRDMIRRGLIVAPVLIAICGVIWQMNGVWSAAYGVAIILVNFAIAAGLIAFTARISLGLMMGAILFGYLVRLGLVLLAFVLVKDAGWISRPALGLTVIVTHLGLLAWELKYVAASLAYPGLKPRSN